MAFRTATIIVELRDGKDGDGDAPGADVALRLSDRGPANPFTDEVVVLFQIIHQPDAHVGAYRMPWRLVPEIVPDNFAHSDQWQNAPTFVDALDRATSYLMGHDLREAWLAMHGVQNDADIDGRVFQERKDSDG
jgi:hypothetical protein